MNRNGSRPGNTGRLDVSAEPPTMVNLSTNAVLAEIRSCYNDRSTGLLGVTSADGGRIEVSFRDGLIDAVSVAEADPGSFLSSHHLGDYLVDGTGASVQDVLSIQSEARRRNLLFGEAALRSGILDEILLQTIVRQQSFDLLRYVMTNDSCAKAFAKSNLSNRVFRVPARICLEHLTLVLARSESAPYRGDMGESFVLSGDGDVLDYPWIPSELCVLAELTRPRQFGTLRSLIRMDEISLRRILGVLLEVGVVDRVDAAGCDTNDPFAPESSDMLVAKTPFDLERLIPVTRSPLMTERLEVARGVSSFTSEQFKNLKVQINEISGAAHKVFTISSPASGDGKSLVSLGLAFSFALDPNRRVLILDCDLRNPAVDRYLGVTPEPGLLQYIANGYTGPHCYLRRVENLYFMSAGGVATNPVEVLSMDKMKNLIATLKRDFDTIIIDAPPYSPIADARLATALSDGLVFVIRRGRTAFGAAERALRAIDRNKLMGIVFNDVKPMLFHTYDSYPYYGQTGDRKVNRGPDLHSGKPPRTYLDS